MKTVDGQDLMKRALAGELPFVMIVEHAGGVMVLGNAEAEKARRMVSTVAKDMADREDGELQAKH